MIQRNIGYGLSAFVWLCAGVLVGPVFAMAEEGTAATKQPGAEMADVVRLSNGNKIVGHVTRIENGVAEIRIDGVGEMEIPLTDITSITKRAYVPPKQPSLEERRMQAERFAQERKEAHEEYRQYMDRRFRQQAFDENQRRQLQMEADWRDFLSHPNVNRRFQEDMFFLRFGGPWGRFAPWGRR